MKKIITLIALIISLNSFAQVTRVTPKAGTYYPGDSIEIMFTSSTKYDQSSIILATITNAHEKADQVFRLRIKYSDVIKNVGHYSFFWTVPDTLQFPGITKAMMRVQMGLQTDYFDVYNNLNPILNPLAIENQNIDFHFYSIQGVHIAHCKTSELPEGLYICNGLKIMKYNN